MGTTALKQASTTNNHFFSALFAIAFVISFVCFWNALKGIDLSIAYAIWAGAGVLLITFMGFIIYKEEISFLKIVFIAFVLIGVVGLKLISKT